MKEGAVEKGWTGGEKVDGGMERVGRTGRGLGKRQGRETQCLQARAWHASHIFYRCLRYIVLIVMMLVLMYVIGNDASPSAPC